MSKKEKKPNLKDLEQQAGEFLAGWQRAKADYDNLQKECARERSAYIKYANANLIIELLPVLDNFKSAFNSVPKQEKDNAWVIGLQHIKKQLEDFFEQQGLSLIKTVGEKFDPVLHEAIESAFEAGKEEDIILKEIKPGYKLNDKVIQVAKVVVCKGDQD